MSEALKSQVKVEGKEEEKERKKKEEEEKEEEEKEEEEEEEEKKVETEVKATLETSKKDIHVKKVPLFIVNLDETPSNRWKSIVAAFQGEITRVRKVIQEFVKNEGGTTGEIVKSILTGTLKQFKWLVYYKDDLESISELSGMPIGELIMMQLVYEATALCTSIVTPNRDNESKPIHIRTMDWEMDFLGPLTIEIIFTRQNKPVCHCTTWAGYVGVLTGMHLYNSETNSEGIGVSVNFRITGGSFWTNLKKTLSGSWPIGFKLRDLLTTPGQTFDSVVTSLKEAELISPVYFTISGSNAGQAIIVTRDRENSINPCESTDECPFVIQTNIDHWSNEPSEDIMWSISRRRKARQRLKEILENNPLGVTSDELWELISIPPIFNDITVYGTLMIPSLGYLETRLPQQREGFKPVSEHTAKALEKISWKTCGKCATRYHISLNVKGECRHSGEWHDEYGKCSKMTCAWNLGVLRIGQCHWSCCYATTWDSSCPKSELHIAQTEPIKKITSKELNTEAEEEEEENDKTKKTIIS